MSLSFDDDPEQYVVVVRLRPGKSKEDRALIPLLRRLVYKLKRLFKKARVRVRADSGFGKSPRLLAARVKESLRRFVLHCPVDFPWAREWYEAALAVGAVPS